jgi:hypothetical protein
MLQIDDNQYDWLALYTQKNVFTTINVLVSENSVLEMNFFLPDFLQRTQNRR